MNESTTKIRLMQADDFDAVVGIDKKVLKVSRPEYYELKFEKLFKSKYGKTLADYYDDSKYQLMHIEMFPHSIIHAECVGGDIDLLVNQRATIGFFPWRFVDGEASIGRCVAFVEDDRYEELAALKATLPKTKFGDAYDPVHVERLNALSQTS